MCVVSAEVDDADLSIAICHAETVGHGLDEGHGQVPVVIVTITVDKL